MTRNAVGVGLSGIATLRGGISTAAIPPYVGPLDPYQASLWAAYGVTKQLSAYAGAAFKAVRSSDSATMDVSFKTDGTIDSAVMLAWAGASTVTVESWYDQTGNGRHAGNTTVANQPRVATAGVYDGFLRFDGVTDGLTITATCTNGIPAISVAWRGQMRSNTAGLICLLSPDLNIQKGFYIMSLDDGGTNRLRMAVSNAVAGNGQFTAWNGTTSPMTSEAGWIVRYDRSLSQASNFAAYRKAWRAGVEQTIAFVATSGSGPTDTTFNAQPYWIGRFADGGAPAALNLKALAIWEANKDADAVAISSAI